MVHHGELGGYGPGDSERSTSLPDMPVTLTTRRYRMGLLGNLSAAPEGTPKPLGYATPASILACYYLGDRKQHPGIPGDLSAPAYAA